MNENPTDDQVAGQDHDRAGNINLHDMPQPKPRVALSGLLLAVTMVLAGSGLYLAYQNRDAGLSAQHAVENQRAKISTLTGRIEGLESQLHKLGERQADLSRSMQDLVNAVPGGNEDWALLEVEFLLIVAMHHLELERDIDAALGAMQTANLRLRGVGGTVLDPVRAQLAKDIKIMKELNTVDTGSLAIFLDELVTNVNNLPLAGATGVVMGHATEESRTLPAQRKGRFDALWQELQNLVVIRRGKAEQQKSIAPDQQYFLYQSLRLELENARLSLLMRDTENLHASVATLQKLINEYFDTNDPGIVNLMAIMQQLSSINLNPRTPDISSSLESLRTYMREKAGVSPQHDIDQGPQT